MNSSYSHVIERERRKVLRRLHYRFQMFAHQRKLNEKNTMGLLMMHTILSGVVKGHKTCHQISFLAQWEEAISIKPEDLNCSQNPYSIRRQLLPAVAL